MIKRTYRREIMRLLDIHKEWKVIDIGGSNRPIARANVVTDIKDLSEFYAKSDIDFVRCSNLKGFAANAFDFAFASHVIEHVPDPQDFCQELVRIASRGYIEIPTPLFDNLYIGNKGSHIHWFYFDDSNECLIYDNRKDVLRPMIDIKEGNLLFPYFRQSMVIELYWEKHIDVRNEPGFFYQCPDDLMSYKEFQQNTKIYGNNPFALGTKTSKIIRLLCFFGYSFLIPLFLQIRRFRLSIKAALKKLV
jgi:hypothetical protein